MKKGLSQKPITGLIPNKCMNQVSDEGSGEFLVVLLKIYKEADILKLIMHKDKGKLWLPQVIDNF